MIGFPQTKVLEVLIRDDTVKRAIKYLLAPLW